MHVHTIELPSQFVLFLFRFSKGSHFASQSFLWFFQVFLGLLLLTFQRHLRTHSLDNGLSLFSPCRVIAAPALCSGGSVRQLDLGGRRTARRCTYINPLANGHTAADCAFGIQWMSLPAKAFCFNVFVSFAEWGFAYRCYRPRFQIPFQLAHYCKTVSLTLFFCLQKFKLKRLLTRNNRDNEIRRIRKTEGHPDFFQKEPTCTHLYMYVCMLSKLHSPTSL